MYLVFDTETTGFPKRWDLPPSATDNWPRCVQLAWQVHDKNGKLTAHRDFLIIPENYNIPYDAEQVHGITTQLANEQGTPLQEVLEIFKQDLNEVSFLIGHNINFDTNVVGAEFYRKYNANPLEGIKTIDTCTNETAFLCKIPGGKGGKFKFPTLTEIYHFLFQQTFEEAHNATADVEATSRVFFELLRGEKINPPAFEKDVISYCKPVSDTWKEVIPLFGLKHINLKKESEKIKVQKKVSKTANVDLGILKDTPFVHLHNHTQFSILQSTISINGLVKAAVDHDMEAVAITDKGNMMGVFKFFSEVKAVNSKLDKKIKPIIGCEFLICEDHKSRMTRDDGYQTVLLAKNQNGYLNLCKMSSISYLDGYYYVPRIDKNILQEYKEDIIVLSGGIEGEITSKLLNVGYNQAEEALLWWKEQFGDDYYLEIMSHGQENEERANEDIVSLSKKHEVKLIATNNTFYINKEDAESHDILLCIKENEKINTPIGKGRGYRFGFPNNEYYFKSAEEMKSLFKKQPDAILNIQSLIDKIEFFDLNREVALPKFDIPEEYKKNEEESHIQRENRYLKDLVFQGAKKKYGELTEEILERIKFELEIIAKTGYPGYFLIVNDLIREARKMGVMVGPGRGSAVGSIVAYTLDITALDPLKYDLLFERFLNPDRVSMPDIDIDFDDEGRNKVIDYVINKYGSTQVAQIITYGTLAVKNSIKDTGRALDYPLSEAARIAGMFPQNGAIKTMLTGDDKILKEKYTTDEFNNILSIRQLIEKNAKEAEVILQGSKIQGSVRNVGVHACGVIITPTKITDIIPVSTAKDSSLVVTQFDNSVVESAGLLKMDFLGLKTLSIIKSALALIESRHRIKIDIENIPIDDAKVYELFQKGETVGIFQFESPGMQKSLKELKPTEFEDIIAMVALYRPGPMDKIPAFVRRKHGLEEVKTDLPEMYEILKSTYGIAIYQEQIMLLSQKLADFTKGDADTLRKGMGKKDLKTIAILKPKFLENGMKNNHPEEILLKIWNEWIEFANYAFNKSHATAYAWISYQCAFLKANYPAEFMASILSHNMIDLKKVTVFMDECKRMSLELKGPDVNESIFEFSVNKKGDIRFGLGAVKGVGKSAVETIVENRKDKEYSSVFDLVSKIDLKAANKKTFEGIILAGGIDCFKEHHRAQFFQQGNDGIPFIDKIIQYGVKVQANKNSNQLSLFDSFSEEQLPSLKIPDCEAWGTLETLSKEKEMVGVYMSGHPLNDYKKEIEEFSNSSIAQFNDLAPLIGKEFTVIGMVNNAEHRISKKGTNWGSFVLEDFSDQFEFRLFTDDYMKFRHLLVKDTFVQIGLKVNRGWMDKKTKKIGEPRIKILNIQLVEELFEKLSKKIILRIDTTKLMKSKIDRLTQLFSKHEGEKAIEFELLDYKEKMSVNLHSKGQKVSISSDLLNELEKEEINYTVV